MFLEFFFPNFRGVEVPSKNRLLAYSIPRVAFIGNTADCKNAKNSKYEFSKGPNNVINTVLI